MTDRKEWDRPAMAIATVLGIVLVAASLPFTVAAFCEQQGCGEPPVKLRPFNVAWSQVAFGAPAQATVDTTGATASGEATLEVVDALPATLRIAFVSCTDTFDARIGQQPATFNYTLTKASPAGESAIVSGTFACQGGKPDPSSFPLEQGLGGHPDVAQVQALDLSDAVRRAWNGTANETATFTLSLVANRPPAQLGGQPLPGLPVAPTRMQAALTLEGTRWALQVSEPPTEAPK